MLKKSNQEFPIQFPVDMYQVLSCLGERRLMTPTYLSTLMMSAILPAKFIVEKNKPLINDKQGECTVESWFARNHVNKVNFDQIKTYVYDKITQTHTFSSLSVDGLETLEAKLKQPNLNPQYKIFYCGNGEDAMHLGVAYTRILNEPNKNYIFWNYPGVGASLGGAHSTHHLFKAGYQQAKRLIDQGIAPNNITLHGFSLGGGVAIHIARQLHEEGHLVNLEIDRSFARIASVIPAIFTRHMTHKETSKQSSYTPLSSSTITFGLLGVALGTTFAGFVASLSLLAASALEAIGYIAAYCIQALGFMLQETISVIGKIIACPFSLFSKSIGDDIQSSFNNMAYYLAYVVYLVAFAINESFAALALLVDSIINLLSSIAGGVIAIMGLVAGSLMGLIFGALLSIQLLWTDTPLIIPMTPAFSVLLHSSCCEMDSVTEIHHLLNISPKSENRTKGQAQIRVSNVVDDPMIDVEASLNVGIGFNPRKLSDDENRPLKEKVTSFWYLTGGHTGRPRVLIDQNLSFSQ